VDDDPTCGGEVLAPHDVPAPLAWVIGMVPIVVLDRDPAFWVGQVRTGDPPTIGPMDLEAHSRLGKPCQYVQETGTCLGGRVNSRADQAGRLANGPDMTSTGDVGSPTQSLQVEHVAPDGRIT